MITHFFSFLDKYKIYKKYLSFFFQVWILAPDGPHVLPWTRPSVRSKNLYFTSISRHICLKIITGLIKPCIFWNQTWLLSRPDGHLDFCTVYPWCCLKENIYTHHFISRTFLGQFGLVSEEFIHPQTYWAFVKSNLVMPTSSKQWAVISRPPALTAPKQPEQVYILVHRVPDGLTFEAGGVRQRLGELGQPTEVERPSKVQSILASWSSVEKIKENIAILVLALLIQHEENSNKEERKK